MGFRRFRDFGFKICSLELGLQGGYKLQDIQVRVSDFKLKAEIQSCLEDPPEVWSNGVPAIPTKLPTVDGGDLAPPQVQ